LHGPDSAARAVDSKASSRFAAALPQDEGAVEQETVGRADGDHVGARGHALRAEVVNPGLDVQSKLSAGVVGLTAVDIFQRLPFP